MFGSCSGILNMSALLKSNYVSETAVKSRTHHMLRQPDLLPFRDKTHWGTFDARRTPLSSHNPCLHTVTVQKKAKSQLLHFILWDVCVKYCRPYHLGYWETGPHLFCRVTATLIFDHKSRTSLSAQSEGNSLTAILRYCVNKNGTDGRTSSLKT